MEAKDYIIKELESFIKKFSKVRVRYDYDENAIVHTIEVLPNEVYHLDKDYIEWECEMFDKFISMYPNENICFISDDALVGIEKEIFVKEGIDYAPFSTNKRSVEINPASISIHQKLFNTFVENPTFLVNHNVLIDFKETKIPVEYTKNFSLQVA